MRAEMAAREQAEEEAAHEEWKTMLARLKARTESRVAALADEHIQHEVHERLGILREMRSALEQQMLEQCGFGGTSDKRFYVQKKLALPNGGWMSL